MAIITIAREVGAFGEEVASRVAGKLGYLLVDKDRLDTMKSEYGLEDIESDALEEQVPDFCGPEDSELLSIRMVGSLLVDLAEEFDLVLLGRGGQAPSAICPSDNQWIAWIAGSIRTSCRGALTLPLKQKRR